MQLVVHAPFGARINRAWGLALRKRFCVRFDFELQAAASDDAILLSLGPQHSFPLEDDVRARQARNAAGVAASRRCSSHARSSPSRWRWNATRALAVPRASARQARAAAASSACGRTTCWPPSSRRPVGCQENLTGPIELPDHPLIRQTMHDCLHEAMDIDGLVRRARHASRRGEIRFHARDTTEPSPMAHEILNGKPYTYLDDAPLEERRTRAVTLRRSLPESARELGALDPDAIERVVDEARPQPRDAEEVHDALLSLVAVRAAGRAGVARLVRRARRDSAAPRIVETADGERLWFAAENLPLIETLYPDAAHRAARSRCPPRPRPRSRRGRRAASAMRPRPHGGPRPDRPSPSSRDRTGLDRGRRRLRASPSSRARAARPARPLPRAAPTTRSAATAASSPASTATRSTACAREIEPVSAQDYMRFLLRWQHLAPGTQLEGKRGVREAIAQLQGFETPAVAWERDILPARVADYRGSWLDELCLAGEVAWARLAAAQERRQRRSSPSADSATPISLARRADLAAGSSPASAAATASRGARAPAPAAEILDLLQSRGALFFDEIVARARAASPPTSSAACGSSSPAASSPPTASRAALAHGVGEAAAASAARSARSSSARLAVSGIPSGRWSLLPDLTHRRTTSADGAATLTSKSWPRPGPSSSSSATASSSATSSARENFTVPWRDILRALRRLEARGLVRGGRFVSGFYGEQYARPEAVDALRGVRRTEKKGERVRVSAVDPLNLVGIITPGPKVASGHTRSVLYRDGIPLSTEETAEAESEARRLVTRPLGF